MLEIISSRLSSLNNSGAEVINSYCLYFTLQSHDHIRQVQVDTTESFCVKKSF